MDFIMSGPIHWLQITSTEYSTRSDWLPMTTFSVQRPWNDWNGRTLYTALISPRPRPMLIDEAFNAHPNRPILQLAGRVIAGSSFRSRPLNLVLWPFGLSNRSLGACILELRCRHWQWRFIYTITKTFVNWN